MFLGSIIQTFSFLKKKTFDKRIQDFQMRSLALRGKRTKIARGA